jgi:hypothetical protein
MANAGFCIALKGPSNKPSLENYGNFYKVIWLPE